MNLVGYLRVSTERQAKTGHSLAAQEATLRGWAERHGHTLHAVIPDVMSGAKSSKLHGREAAIRLVEAGVAEALLVLKYDRATRSMLDAQHLLQRSRERGWAILTVDGKDSSDRGQMLMTDVEMAFAAEERRRIADRTREGLTAARAAGKRLGRPEQITDDVRAFILAEHDAGRSARAIAQALTERGIPAPGGSLQWSHSTVSRALRRWYDSEDGGGRAMWNAAARNEEAR